MTDPGEWWDIPVGFIGPGPAFIAGMRKLETDPGTSREDLNRVKVGVLNLASDLAAGKNE